MLRGSKTPLRVKENESGCPGRKEEASFTPSRDQKSCKATKSKVVRPSKKENFGDGNQTGPPKRALKWPKVPEEHLCQPRGSDVSWQLPGVLSEPPSPLHTRGDCSSSRAVPLGNDFCTPERDKEDGKPDFGLSEQRKKPGGFAAVITAEFGTAQEGFGKRATGTSPTSLKFRRRSTIGLRGSPENNTLIRYLAQQRSSRQGEAFTQISPFKPANVRSLKDKIDAFQASFESLQEAEGEAGLSHLGEPSQQRGSCKLIKSPAQSKAPFKKEPSLEHWSEKFSLSTRGTALKGNLSENGTKSSRSELRICSILSPHRAVAAPDPAAAKEWVCERQNPVKSLETVVTGDSLETGHVSRCDRGDAVSDLSPRKAVEDVSLGMLGGNQTPGTPLGAGNIPSSDLSQSSSLLRSILKKTPGMELGDSPKEYSSRAIDKGGGESAAGSSCVTAIETLQTETPDAQSSKTPRKKKVTFGEVLSPEIFDQSLPANTPLRRGASPGHGPGARPALSEEPLPLLDFGWDDEGVEPLPEFLEGSVAAEAPSPVENAEADTHKPDVITTRSSTKRKQGGAVAEGTDQSSSGALSTESDKGTKNPRRSKIQRQKNPSTAAPKKTQKTKYPCYGKRRKKRVKKSLYGEREMASKKPLLSPIPEIPEVFSSVSSPNSPKADGLFTGACCRSEPAALAAPAPEGACRDTGGTFGKENLEEAAATSSGHPEVPGSLEGAPGSAPEFSVPGAEGDFDTSEYFQQGKETPREKAAKHCSSLIEKEELEGNLLTEPGILEPQDEQERAQRAKRPLKDSVRGDPARRRRRRSSSTFYFPPVENTEITGADLPFSCYSVEEVLSVPRAQEGSLQGRRSSAELRVRRSMRLSRDAAAEGLAWIQLPLPAAPKGRRSISASVLAGAENVRREQNPLPWAAPGKENEGSAALAAAPGSTRRRRSLSEATARETLRAPSQRRRSTNSGCGKDGSDQNHSGAAETLELRWKDVSGISDFLK
ncbi:cell division cycle-associated protein 2 isoform X3 [Hirundo rustica]|uniref:cell division cycle-associated protein 2 isoform X3 n=1 Tax=Hirundo rustica TaxID=43150 RepID=UPI001A95373D|nr:cell division cycle-associated protein 2 isoform X3 [Hirundo rustica]